MKNEKKKILIIDDDRAIGDMLKTLLEFQGYEAVASTKPLKAKENILSNEADLVILDVRLSGVDGKEICAGLKKDEDVKDVPVLMMSALSGVDATCKKAGADGFVSKPFEMDTLISTIEEVLTRQKA